MIGSRNRLLLHVPIFASHWSGDAPTAATKRAGYLLPSNCTARFGGPLRIVIAEASVQFRKSLLQQSNIFPGGRLKRPEFALVNVRDPSGLNGFKEFDQPVSLLMPVLRVHYSLPTSR